MKPAHDRWPIELGWCLLENGEVAARCLCRKPFVATRMSVASVKLAWVPNEQQAQRHGYELYPFGEGDERTRLLLVVVAVFESRLRLPTC